MADGTQLLHVHSAGQRYEPIVPHIWYNSELISLLKHFKISLGGIYFACRGKIAFSLCCLG